MYEGDSNTKLGNAVRTAFAIVHIRFVSVHDVLVLFFRNAIDRVGTKHPQDMFRIVFFFFVKFSVPNRLMIFVSRVSRFSAQCRNVSEQDPLFVPVQIVVYEINGFPRHPVRCYRSESRRIARIRLVMQTNDERRKIFLLYSTS